MDQTLNKLSLKAWTVQAVVIILSTQLNLTPTFVIIPPELQRDADLLPEETLVFVGETLRMRCTISPDAVKKPNGGFRFTITSHQKNLSWNISSEDVKDINETAADVNVTVTDQFSRTNTIECFKGSTWMRATYLFAERPVQNITNFTGVYYYDQRRRIDVSWSVGVDYINSNNVNVIVDYAANLCPNNQSSGCANQTKEFCSIQGEAEDVIVFRIQVLLASFKRPEPEYLQPLYGTSATSCQVFIPPYNLKTNPPDNLQALPASSTCANLTWVPTKYFNDSRSETLFQIIARTADNPLTEVVFEGRHPFIPGTQEIQICSLKPFTTYSITVKIRGNKLPQTQILWSEPALTSVTTLEDKPLTGPYVTLTSFYAQDCFNGSREVFVYWNPPAAESVQGRLLGYEAQLNSSQKLDPVITSAHYANFVLNCNSHHQIQIFCFTKIGKSQQPSQVFIPTKSEELPPLEDITVRLVKWNSSASVNWILGSSTPRNVVLLLYIFENGNKPESFSNDFQVREVSAQLLQLNLTGLSTSPNLMFGYALQLNGSTTAKRGITWINCVYDPQKRPEQPRVNPVLPDGDGSLDISWTSTRCNRLDQVMILWYHIYVCSQEVPADTTDMNKYCKNYTVNGKESHYLVRGLVGGQTHFVYLQLESEAGLSRMSQPARGTTSEDAMSSNIGLIIGVTLGMLVVACLILFVLRKCKGSRSSIKSLATETSHNGTKPKLQAKGHTLWSNQAIPPFSPAPDPHSTDKASLQQKATISHKLIIKPSGIRQELNAICLKFKRKTSPLNGEGVFRSKSEATEDTAIDNTNHMAVISDGEIHSSHSVDHLPQQTQDKAKSSTNNMQQLPPNVSSSCSVPYIRLTSTEYHDNSVDGSLLSTNLKPATLLSKIRNSSDPNFSKLAVADSSFESLQQSSQPDLEDEGYNSPQGDANVPIYLGSPQVNTNVPVSSGSTPQAAVSELQHSSFLLSQLQHPSLPFLAHAVGQVYNCSQAGNRFTVPEESVNVCDTSVNESNEVESNESTGHSYQITNESTGHSNQSTNESTGHSDQSTGESTGHSDQSTGDSTFHLDQSTNKSTGHSDHSINEKTGHSDQSPNESCHHSDHSTINSTSSYVTCTYKDNFEAVSSNTVHKILTEESSSALSLSDTSMLCQPNSHPLQNSRAPGNQCQPVMLAPVTVTERHHKISPAFAKKNDPLANVGPLDLKNPLALFDTGALNTSVGSCDLEDSFCLEVGNDLQHDSSQDCPTSDLSLVSSGKKDYISSLGPQSPVTDYCRVASDTQLIF